jgi:MerR family transcriptional regulator, light-induced transcriptional regulator
MNAALPMPHLSLSIAAVERDTGVSKDTLRVWERRYAFPRPTRDASGERAYPLDQVERLRVIKRLVDAGHRPGRVTALPLTDLLELAEAAVDPRPAVGRAAPAFDELASLVERIRDHDMAGLQHELLHHQARSGLRSLVADRIAPLNQRVGDTWMRGQLQVFEEHLYSEVIETVLRVCLLQLPPARAPVAKVLLSTVPGEPHGLGLLMAQAVLALEGCHCVSLGVQTPLQDMAAAARALDVHVVALGFAGSLGVKAMQDRLTGLRALLPPAVQLWAGGAAAGLQRHALPGVRWLPSLDDIPPAVRQLAAPPP